MKSPSVHSPTVDSWTLKFKHFKSIIYLHTEPDTPFSTLKQDLLTALKDLASDSMTRESLSTLPEDPEHIVFAVPVSNDPDEGWVPLDIPETEVEDDASGETRTVGGPDSIVNRDPQSAGLKDGSQIAFRFLTDGEISSGEVKTDPKLWNVQQPLLDDAGDLEMDDATEDEGKVHDRDD